MKHEIEINEELIEEIDTLLLEELGVGYNLPKVYGHRTIRKAITLILSAVRDGKQKIPGEVGRGIVDVVRCNPITYQIEGFVASDEDLSEAMEISIIALRPEEEK